MRELDADLLVTIVTELATRSVPVVKATDVVAWCTRHKVDCSRNGRNNGTLEIADNEEARATRPRLQKFKKGRQPGDRVGWCLSEDRLAGCRWAVKEGWLVVPLVDGKWDPDNLVDPSVYTLLGATNSSELKR